MSDAGRSVDPQICGGAFEREERYIVIKRKHLDPIVERLLRDEMRDLGVSTVGCVVVESDWPEYETVWRMIEDRVSGVATPAPGQVEAAVRPDDELLLEHLPDALRGEKRCGIQRSDWLTGWFVPWSPRNDNQNAEGPWNHWVELARKILEADRKALAALAATKPSLSPSPLSEGAE